MILIFLLLASLQASAADTVKEFRGTGNTTTAVFKVDSPWLLDWRLDGDFPQMVALDITLIEAPSGRYVGRVLRTKPSPTFEAGDRTGRLPEAIDLDYAKFVAAFHGTASPERDAAPTSTIQPPRTLPSASNSTK